MNEIWKDIIGYEGIYQISNTGRVRSLPRKTRYRNGRVVQHKGKILVPQKNSAGYQRVPLARNGVHTAVFVHRLVAIHFVENPNPSEFTIVNHLDCNPLNNNSENLEWTTMKGNSLHAFKSGRMKRTPEWERKLRRTNEINGKAVVGENLETGERVFYTCLNDCKNDGFQRPSVCVCCKGKRKTHKGYTWRYATPEEKKMLLEGYGV